MKRIYGRFGGLCRLLERLSAVFLLFSFIAGCGAIHCHKCINPLRNLNSSKTELRVKSQSDIFYYPIGTAKDLCHEDLKTVSDYTDQKSEIDICSKEQCFTLKPNVKDANFTVRGCVDSLSFKLLRRFEKRLSGRKKDSCYLVAARPIYRNTPFVDLNYVLCVCDTALCNSEAQKPYVPFEIKMGKYENDLIELNRDMISGQNGGKVGESQVKNSGKTEGPDSGAVTKGGVEVWPFRFMVAILLPICVTLFSVRFLQV